MQTSILIILISQGINMYFILGFLSAILMICIFSAIVHNLQWIQDTFQGTICAVEADTDKEPFQ
jgi:hypothetical protein